MRTLTARIALPTAERALTLLQRWPLPALLAWLLGWGLHLTLALSRLPAWLGVAVAVLPGIALGLRAPTRMRGLIVAGGFPLSLLLTGAGAELPAWAWLLPLALLMLLYPRSAWRDAPLFPTPHAALDALALSLPLAPGAHVLDAGCGLGHGLRALRRAYPRARLEGVESSALLAWATRLHCPYARVHRADLWRRSWAGYDLVYLFQRPESMPRALAKAQAEMARGSWVASLEFEAPGLQPQHTLRCPDGRTLWLYRLPVRAAGGVSSAGSRGR